MPETLQTKVSHGAILMLALAALASGCAKSDLGVGNTPRNDQDQAIAGVDAGVAASVFEQPVGGLPARRTEPRAALPTAPSTTTPTTPVRPGVDAGAQDIESGDPESFDAGPTGECAPRLTRCGPVGEPQVCSALGEWESLGVCQEGLRCTQGRCACTPAAPTRCRGDSPTPQYCDDQGVYRDAERCSDPTPVCLAGRCVECEPGLSRCLPDGSIESCDKAGFLASRACPDGEPCMAGSCSRRVAVSASGYIGRTCAVLDDASLKCWGWGSRLGLEDATTRGLHPGEMGDALPRINLGTGRRVLDVGVGETHACALLDGGEVKCWGDGGTGQLGLGDRRGRGTRPGEMGDALPAVDLGSGRTATAIAVGGYHSCALLDDATLKCWGENYSGELGQGDQRIRGGAPGEMGDALPPIDLGTGRSVKAVAAGWMTCALLDNGQVKCWGDNEWSILGLGYRDDNRGDEPGEMGDSLPAIDLGTGRTATAISLRASHACALLDNGDVKCWGLNLYGQLGNGTTADVGDEPGEMGDVLPAVDLGTGRRAVKIATGIFHTCAILDDATLKCWGAVGEVVNGEPSAEPTAVLGDEPGEMGDALPVVDLGTDRKVIDVFPGLWGTCALLDDYQLKCWGDNSSGQLGLGIEKSPFGLSPGETGDALPAVDLGH